MLIVELVGGPCTGKTTLAHKLFSKVNKLGYKVAFVSEFAKELWYQKHPMINYQIQVFSEQLWRYRMLDDVDLVITDTSLLLGLIYSKEKNPFFKDMLLWEYNQYNNLTYYLDRGDLPYQEHGRYQNYEEAKMTDVEIFNLLVDTKTNFKKIQRKDATKLILNDIKDKIEKA